MTKDFTAILPLIQLGDSYFGEDLKTRKTFYGSEKNEESKKYGETLDGYSNEMALAEYEKIKNGTCELNKKEQKRIVRFIDRFVLKK